MKNTYKSKLPKSDEEDREMESDNPKEETEDSGDVTNEETEEEKQEKNKEEGFVEIVDKTRTKDNDNSDDSDTEQEEEMAALFDKTDEENVSAEDDIIINEDQSIPFTEKEEKEFLDSYDHFLKED